MAQPIRVLELRSVRGTGGGPEKTILHGAAQADPRRFAVTVCYVRDRRDRVFAIDHEATRLGVDYVEVEEAHSLDLAVFGRLRALVRAKQIDIVHAHEYKSDALAILLAQAEGIAPLATVHGWTGHTRRERWMYYPVDKRVLSRFPRLVAVSSDIRSELIRHGADPSRVAVVLNGIDHRAFAPRLERRDVVRREMGLTPGDYVIGTVGRAEPQKRFDLLLEAFASLFASRQDLRLVIAGDGSLRSRLARQAEALGIAHACRLLGHRKDVADLHSAFDLFVQSSDYEGTPNAVLEAMACGTPIVATDVGGTSELARHAKEALIVPPGNPLVLGHAMALCLGDRAAARELAANGRKRVETDLSFERRMATVERIYEELCDRRRAAAPCEAAS